MLHRTSKHKVKLKELNVMHTRGLCRCCRLRLWDFANCIIGRRRNCHFRKEFVLFFIIVLLTVFAWLYFGLSIHSVSHRQWFGNYSARASHLPIGSWWYGDTYVCPWACNDTGTLTDRVAHASLRANWSTEARALLVTETQFSSLGKDLIFVLDSMRMDYNVVIPGKSFPLLASETVGRYAIVIFENMHRYLSMDSWARQVLDKYCRDYGVGMIMFGKNRGEPPASEFNITLNGLALTMRENVMVSEVRLSDSADLFHMTRAGRHMEGRQEGNDWIAFFHDRVSYEPILTAKIHEPTTDGGYWLNISKEGSLVVHDRGKLDGIRRVLFGQSFSFWLHRLLFMDAVSFLTQFRFGLPLKRYFHIDVDDVFVGGQGFRLTRPDVEAMEYTQNKLAGIIPGFQLHLGFSGKFLHRGNKDECDGEDYLLSRSSSFSWFPHSWSHRQAHTVAAGNYSLFLDEMKLNRYFAQQHNLPLSGGYAVAPHHSGVYPVHEPLYKAWRSVWDIGVTSTEQCPHLNPASKRRGFVHKGIAVLPRQTCGLFTHTVFYDKYPRGSDRLENLIRGGNLFFTFVYNMYLMFMTHSTNYANDRLALYTFESVVEFVRCWTNLQLESIPPMEMASQYFARYPEEKVPIWVNPCHDKRHKQIWAGYPRMCDRFPQLLVLGPQKTGTTALHTFLKLHPDVKANLPSEDTFEEIQFFSGKRYEKGLNWYLSFFPAALINGSESSKSLVLFEKSATYFESELAPKRVHALIPGAKLIVIVSSPVQRAYSWYQHMRAHDDPTALSYSFDQLLEANHSSPRPVWNLRNKCLLPGLYVKHIERWLNFFPAKQLLLVDGEQLKKNPVTVMQHVQAFMEVDNRINYDELIRFDPRKGFYCQILPHNRTKCLGRGKGRRYAAMGSGSRRFLLSYYRPHNVALEHLLNGLGYSSPRWLREELAEEIN